MSAALKPVADERLPPLEQYLSLGQARGIAWTPLRKHVLEMLWRDGRPWGLYILADEMRKAGRCIHVKSLYRVLDTLQVAGLIVSIATSRRVQISPDPKQREWAVLQCSRCERSWLVPFAREAKALREAAAGFGYVADKLVIECVGCCRSCIALEGKTGSAASP
jgi:Fur family transcriptional regulator, zinc uptake regulator